MRKRHQRKPYTWFSDTNVTGHLCCHHYGNRNLRHREHHAYNFNQLGGAVARTSSPFSTVVVVSKRRSTFTGKNPIPRVWAFRSWFSSLKASIEAKVPLKRERAYGDRYENALCIDHGAGLKQSN